MIEDFGAFAGQDAVFNGDVCIIGAGAAGITLARGLLGSGLDVCLLESGGRDYESDTQDMAIGESTGYPYYDLRESRLRFFGGTTAIWGGRVAQLDDIDFCKRSWVPHSGWPINKTEMQPYYRQAQGLLELPVVDGNEMPGFKSPLDHNVLQPAFWQFDETHDRFTLSKCSDLENDPKIRILLHATATEIRTTDNGKAVRDVVVKNLKGGKGTVKARAVVLAAGGLEVPRLLLASCNGNHPRGIGNNSDLVGRFFMEHPHARGARVDVNDARKLFKIFPRFVRQKDDRYGMLFRPGDQWQEDHGILNTGFTLAVRKDPGEKQVAYKALYNTMRHELSPTSGGRKLWRLTRRAAVKVQDRFGASLNNRKMKKPGYGLYAVMRAEQAPNPDSRVLLSDEKDGLGMPRLKLDWQMNRQDKESVKSAMAALDQELKRLEMGKATPAAWLNDNEKSWHVDPLVSNHAIGGYHHIGTTRMADSEKDGVVDAQCRVHGIENLYIAGSSVFSTGGWANPTLTILALSLRLANELKSKY